MITAIIECRGEAGALASTLAALVPAAVEGVLRDVIVVASDADEETHRVAEAAGCRIVSDGIAEAVASARGEWLLLLEPGARPQPGWLQAIEMQVERGAAAARFRLGGGWRGWLRRVTGRVRPLEQGLLIRRDLVMAQAKAARRLDDLARGRRGMTMDCGLAAREP